MDPIVRLLILMQELVRRRWRRAEVLLLAGILVCAGVLGVFEWLFGWPEALTINRIYRGRLPPDGGVGS